MDGVKFLPETTEVGNRAPGLPEMQEPAGPDQRSLQTAGCKSRALD